MFRKFYFLTFILLLFLSAVLFSCYKNINNSGEGIKELSQEIAELQKELESQQKEMAGYITLTRNLNKLLGTVYYGSALPAAEGREKSFTAFSMYYKGNFYIITAGHCVEYNNEKYTSFKFKSNEKNIWIYPRLLYYETDYDQNRDFAIFTHKLIKKGLIVEENDMEPSYVLGSIERKLNFFKKFSTAREGESGSPILSKDCKLVGIVIKNNSEYTPVQEITRAIDMILQE